MTDSNRWGIIFSSPAHSIRAHKRWVQMRQYMESRNVAYDFVQSDGDGSVERLTRMLCENGYRTLVIVGGDGSLNDAVNGIMSVSQLPDDFAFGVVPIGIGNDFASFWGINADDWRQAIDNIITRRTRLIDIGICQYTDENGQDCLRHFLNCVNVGYGARLVGLTNRWQRLIGSKRLSLIPVFIANIFERKSFKVCLQADSDVISQEVMSICVGNATGYGQTPNAVPYNGLLDMSVITRPLWWQVFEGFWLLGKGQFLNYRNVHPYRIRNVRFSDLGRSSVSLDGRMLTAKSFGSMQLSVRQELVSFIVSAV